MGVKDNENADIDIIEIINRAKAGDPQAFSRLYNLYYTPVYKYIYFRIGKSRDDSAEDITQDVFLKAYTSFASYSYTGKSLLAYLYTIARNTLIDRGRKKKIQLVELDSEDSTLEQIPDTANGPSDQYAKKEESEDLRAHICLLSPDQQDVIILRFIEELTTKEISETLGKSEEAVRQLQSKGLRALRDILNKHDST